MEDFPGAVFHLFPFLNLFVPGEFGDGIRHNRAGIQKASLTIRLLALKAFLLGWIAFSGHSPHFSLFCRDLFDFFNGIFI